VQPREMPDGGVDSRWVQRCLTDRFVAAGVLGCGGLGYLEPTTSPNSKFATLWNRPLMQNSRGASLFLFLGMSVRTMIEKEAMSTCPRPDARCDGVTSFNLTKIRVFGSGDNSVTIDTRSLPKSGKPESAA
jgi:hypothetical protein